MIVAIEGPEFSYRGHDCSYWGSILQLLKVIIVTIGCRDCSYWRSILQLFEVIIVASVGHDCSYWRS